MTQASAFERCTASVFIEGSWRGTLRLPADARPGPVAVIGAGDALRQRLARLVTLAGLGSSVLAQASTGPQLTDALRLSLSHEDVAAVVVCDLPAQAIAQARGALREAARAVPLVVLDPAARLASEVIALKWLAAHGIAVTPSCHETIAALPVLIGLEPLTGPTVAIVGADENAVHWLNVEARNAGFEPVGAAGCNLSALHMPLGRCGWQDDFELSELIKAIAQSHVIEAELSPRAVECGE